jgi:hypothetical protein
MFDLKHVADITAGGVAAAVLIGTLVLGSCGGDDSPANTATGGTPAATGGADQGSGGTTGTSAGGTTGSGTAGSGACTHTPAPKPMITDFSNFQTNDCSVSGCNWGLAANGDLTGGTFTYKGPEALSGSITINPIVDTTEGNLHLTASVPGGGYAGFGFWFGPCVSAAAFTGITFTIGGTLGGGSAEFQLQTSKDYPIDTINAKGECTGSWSQGCASNKSAVSVPATATPVTLLWTVLTGGQPEATVDPSEILGVQWQFNCPATATTCAVDITLDDVTFS